MRRTTDRTQEGLSFGPFHLFVSERLLTRERTPIELGARALDLLIALTASPNEVVSKQDLMSRVWPDVVVDEGSLRFHMNSLRKALGDRKDGARYIVTLPGRGYCFVAPISRQASRRETPPVEFLHANLPSRQNRMVGREEDVLKLSTQLAVSRIVAIVGAGGIGKTTVAIAVGNHLSEDFNGGVLFVDFGMLSDPSLVAPGVASMLGLAVGSDDIRPSLIAYLRDKRLLLILDTCEHLIDAVAKLTAVILESAPQVHILATSREALRIDGEQVYKLGALEYPPDDPEIATETVLSFPAMQLFMDRAAASGIGPDISDADARVVAGICRKLDGVALALELAARRVETCGLPQTAALLDQHLTLGWLGSRTAPARQKTLQATLDWSYALLSESERVVLRRLAIFVGHFTLDAAIEVATSAGLDRSTVFNAIDSLVGKFLIATQQLGAMMRYRLLDTTRAYVLDTEIDDPELASLAGRHASYYQRWLAQSATEWGTPTTWTERAPHFAALNNARAALEWCFGEGGDARIGIALASAAAPAFLAMSLLPECHRWSERAILVLDEAARGRPEEMHLQAVFGISLTYLRGKSDAALAALKRSVSIAEECGDPLSEVGLLGMLRTFYFRSGDFENALLYARRCRTAALTIEDSAATAQACSLLGRSLHLMGDLTGARAELETSLQHWSRARRATIYLAHELHYPSDVTLARTLWLQGLPDQARDRSHQVIDSAARIDRPAALVVVLGWAASVFLWTGDLQSAEEYIDKMIYQAQSNSLGPFMAVGQARKGELAILRGDAKNGVDSLRAGLDANHALGYEVLTTEFNISLVQGLKAVGQFSDAVQLVDQTIEQVELNGDGLYMPELLRVKGGLLLSMQERRIDDAEKCFAQSLALSRRQGARAWELRTATDLSAFWASQTRRDEARALLRPVLAQFTEGTETVDLKTAERLLAELG
jgi:predicted ATPase/DNA-binding winged helix-turn-helix (wHTH) protein